MKSNTFCGIPRGSTFSKGAKSSILLSVWLTVLWLIVCINPIRACQMPLPHGATWYGVCNGDQVKMGDAVLLCWGWNNNEKIKYIEVEVVQTAGFRDNGLCLSVSNQQIYYKKSACDSYTDQAKQICEDILLCPRSGTFTVKITVGLRGNFIKSCPRQLLTTTINFTVLDLSIIPIPTNDFINFVCPDKPCEMVVDDQVAGQDGVDWYNWPACIPVEPASMNPEYSGYKYPVQVSAGQTIIKYPAYFKKYTKQLGTYRNGQSPVYTTSQCKVHGARVPNSAIGLQLGLVPPPTPLYRTICDDKPVHFQIENPGGEYTGVYWYDQPSGGVPIHDGFNYSRSFSSNYTVLYIAYYKKLGEGCVDQSLVKSPVIVVNLKSISDQAFGTGLARPIARSYQITDYRDVNTATLHCNEPGQEGLYWIDLENDEMDQQLADLSASIENVVNALNIAGGPVQVSANITDSYWQAYDNATGTYARNGIYLDQSGKKIVCSDYICAKGQSLSRRYEKIGNISFSYSYLNPITGAQERQSDLVCGSRMLAIVSIESVHPQQTPTEKCEPLTMQNIAKYTSQLGNILSGCNNYQFISACPDKIYEIGPSDLEIKAMYTATTTLPFPLLGKPYKSVEWTPATGLSNSTVIRPTLPYKDIPGGISNFIKYTARITFINDKKSNHCTIIYKCDACGTIDTPKEIDSILQTP